jgi:hypothetical protein
VDLTSQAAEFTHQWLKDHCEPQPDNDESLTWYVTASTLFTAYANACYKNNFQPLDSTSLWHVIKIVFKNARPQRLSRGTVPIYTGIRFYVDKIGGGMKF